jgi:hypothetical protein
MEFFSKPLKAIKDFFRNSNTKISNNNELDKQLLDNIDHVYYIESKSTNEINSYSFPLFPEEHQPTEIKIQK